MKFEISVTSDKGEVYSGEGPTMSDASRRFCLAMTNAPEPFSTEAVDSWEIFYRETWEIESLRRQGD